MAKGTGGTIYLIGLIFAIIVAFVLLGIAYYMNTKWTEVTAELVDSKKKLNDKNEEVAALTNQVQQLNKLINGGQGGAAGYAPMVGQYLEGANVKLQDMLNEEYIALGPELELIKSQEVKDVWKRLQGSKDQFPRYTNFVDYQLDCLQQLQACLHIIPGLYVKLIRSEEEKEAIRKQIEDNRKVLQEQIDTLTKQWHDTDDQRIDVNRRLQNETRQHQDDKDAKDKEITAVKREGDIAQTKLKRQIDTLDNRIKELTKRSQRVFSDVAQPDGEVTFADAKLATAWINLGKSNGIQRGMRFQAYQNSKGGRHHVKAWIEVKKVEQDSSTCAILQDYEYYDPELKEKSILPYENDPVVKGDLIRSVFLQVPDGRPVYEKGEVPKFFFLGKNVGNRFYTKNELAKKIEEFGGKVLPELTADVKYVVILPKGEDEDHDNNEKAIRFGTTFIKEDELLDFIGK